MAKKENNSNEVEKEDNSQRDDDEGENGSENRSDRRRNEDKEINDKERGGEARDDQMGKKRIEKWISKGGHADYVAHCTLLINLEGPESIINPNLTKGEFYTELRCAINKCTCRKLILKTGRICGTCGNFQGQEQELEEHDCLLCSNNSHLKCEYQMLCC